MSLNVLIGAILGSGVAIFLGGAPARALLARVKARMEERR
jgi:hypothetical protein